MLYLEEYIVDFSDTHLPPYLHFESSSPGEHGLAGHPSVFGRPYVKRFALSYRTVVLFVCDVDVLWPNGWMDEDETWHAGRPRPRPHCVR